MTDTRKKLIRLAASMPKGSTERKALLNVLTDTKLAGNLDSARSFNIQLRLYASVSVSNVRFDGTKLQLHLDGKANLTATTGSEQAVVRWDKDVRFKAICDLKHGLDHADFSVEAQNKLYEGAIEGALRERKKLILRDLIEEGVVPSLG